MYNWPVLDSLKLLSERNLSIVPLSGEEVRFFSLSAFSYGPKGNDSGSWMLKPGVKLPEDEDLRKETPPDDVALFECMLAGIQRLADFGIERIHRPIDPAILDQFDWDHPLREAVTAMDEEVNILSFFSILILATSYHSHRGISLLASYKRCKASAAFN